MCLTGVDYFSTLGYQPGIAFLAAGLLSPLATLILVLVTLLAAYRLRKRGGAKPGWRRAASLCSSSCFRGGRASCSCSCCSALRRPTSSLRSRSPRPMRPRTSRESVRAGLDAAPGRVTLVLVALLGAIFLRGFGEAIGLAVGLVAVYLSLNVVVIWVALCGGRAAPGVDRALADRAVPAARQRLDDARLSLLLFPKLALGLSGFETGVAVMPLDRRRHRGAHSQYPPPAVDGGPDHERLSDRSSSFATTLLIAPRDFAPGGPANGRALALLAHELPGRAFRHTLRSEHDRYPVVRRRLGDGRTAESGAALSAALRHGAGVGERVASAGPGVHGDRRWSDHPVPGRTLRRRVAHTLPACCF